MQNSKENIVRARTIMSKLAHFTEEDKEMLCMETSGGRTNSLSRLTPQEGREVCFILQRQLPKPINSPMKRKIISRALDLGWKNKQGKIDMKRLDGWCIKYGAFKKPLDKHSDKELQMVVTAFDKFYHYVIKKL